MKSRITAFKVGCVLLILAPFSVTAQTPIVPNNTAAAAGQNGVKSSCEPTPQIRKALNALALDDDVRFPSGVRKKQKLHALRSLLNDFPDDIFINQRFQDVALTGNDSERTLLIERYRELLTQLPNNPIYLYLYARLLVGYKTPQAKSLFEAALQRDPNFPWAFVGLTDVYNLPRYRDQHKAVTAFRNLYSLCSGALSPELYSGLKHLDDVTLLAEAAKALRNRLEAAEDRDAAEFYQTLWRLEFRSLPVAEHATLRAQIKADMNKLRKRNHEKDKQWFETLRAGYRILSDEPAKRWAEDQILLYFPYWVSALRLVLDRWQEENPYPDWSGPADKLEAYYRRLLSVTDEWIKKWPNDAVIWNRRFTALVSLQDSTLLEVEVAFNELQKATNQAGNFLSIPPAPVKMAEFYLKRNLKVRLVPRLVYSGFLPFEMLVKREGLSDSHPPDQANSAQLNLSSVYWTGWPVLLEGYLRTDQVSKSQAILQQMRSLLVSEKAADNSAADKSVYLTREATYWEWSGRVAEVEGRKLDALSFYQRSVSIRPASDASTLPDTARIIRRIEHLWKQLGGTKEGWTGQPFRTAENNIEVATLTTGEWQKNDKSLGDFKLSDLSGRTWQLSDLNGKVVFVNIWATWCAPCRQELPFVQKLYEQLNERKDVIVMSFNVDEDVSLVQPYVNAKRLRFPVIPAHSFIKNMFQPNGLAIPRSWIITPDGTLIEQIGFGGDGEKWLVRTAEQLEKSKIEPEPERDKD